MKKIIFFMLLTSNMFSQTIAYNKPVVITPTEVGKSEFQYVTGSDKIPGYDIKVVSSSKKKIKKFSNGKTAPILQLYVLNNDKYIGGILEDEKENKTIIKNITLSESGKTLLFIVHGSDFSKSFTLDDGSLLVEGEKTTVFYTDKIGIWKINKK